jgi:hypothetical protein
MRCGSVLLSLISFQGSGHGGSVKETLVFFKYDAEVPRRCSLVLGLGVVLRLVASRWLDLEEFCCRVCDE